MRSGRKRVIFHVTVVISVVMFVICFAVALITMEEYAKEDCFNHIEETTVQMADMFVHAMRQSQDQLTVFADILAANSSNPKELLQTYMQNFCQTQNFTAVCIHRRDGTTESYGRHPHNEIRYETFEKEAAMLPYISDVFAMGEGRREHFVHLAVPIVRGGDIIAVLYGYIPLDIFPEFISPAAYDGQCWFYIVDGNTGDFLMDEYHRYGEDGKEIPLANIYDGSMGDRESRPGYDMESMCRDVLMGESGYYVFKSRQTAQWYYTYYMPMGINNWSMQMTLDEPTAFATYYEVRETVFMLVLCVAVLALIMVLTLSHQNRMRRKQDVENLHKADYVNRVRGALITAHNNPDFVEQALKLVAKEIRAETVLLLTLSNKVISAAHYWPSGDKSQAMALIGVNVRDTFPFIFDSVVSNESIFCNEQDIESKLSQSARDILHQFDVHNILLEPIADRAGSLKGVLAAVNLADEKRNANMVECVAGDFFMAITNLENHNIIKKMGTMDYLTGVKNRNSFERESADYETMRGETLWCTFVDVNGLHELNNTKGHKAGDAMLCAVAEAVKRIFGAEHTYRMGGDEFVAFRLNSTHEELMSCKYRLLDDLARKGYSVAVGFEGTEKNENGVFDVEKITSEAEAIMYREKWNYYQSHGISTEREYPQARP